MPTLRFNTGTGSNTAASGSNGAITAGGTAASFSGSVVTLDGSPTLTGFSATADVLWLKTSTGRQFFDLSAADNGAKTVTCVNAPAGTATGLTWGIGGKRATLDNADSRLLFADWKTAWTVELEDDQTLSTTGLSLSTVAPTAGAAGVVLKSNVASTPRTITQSSNASVVICNSAATNGKITLIDIKLACSNGTKTSANGITASGGASNPRVILDRCILGDVTNTLLNGYNTSTYLYMTNTTVQYATNIGITACSIMFIYDSVIKNNAVCGISMPTGGTLRVSGTAFAFNGSSGGMSAGQPNIVVIYDCYFADNTGNGITIGNASFTIENCLIVRNGGDGIQFEIEANCTHEIIGCTCAHNTSDGISTEFGSGGGEWIVVRGCNLTHNGGYGLRNAVACRYEQYNNFGTGASANTLGTLLTGTIDATSEAVDPQYTNAAGNDYSVGNNSKGKGWPPNSTTFGAGQSSTYTFKDRGAIQRQENAILIYTRRQSTLLRR